MSDIGIGSTVWVFEANRRVYAKKRAGDAYGHGGPIYREHFVARKIYGETKRSWLVGEDHDPIRVDKKTLTTRSEFGRGCNVLTSEHEVDDACYVEDTRNSIADAVRRCRNASVLRQIEALLGVA